MPSIFQRNWVIAVTTTTRPIMSFLVLFWPKLCFYCFMVNCAIFSTNSFFSSLPLPKVLCLMAATVATSLTQFYDIEGKKARTATAKLSLLLYVVQSILQNSHFQKKMLHFICECELVNIFLSYHQFRRCVAVKLGAGLSLIFAHGCTKN